LPYKKKCHTALSPFRKHAEIPPLCRGVSALQPPFKIGAHCALLHTQGTFKIDNVATTTSPARGSRWQLFYFWGQQFLMPPAAILLPLAPVQVRVLEKNPCVG